MTEEEMMDQTMKEFIEEDDKMHKADAALLETVKGMVSPREFEAIEEELTEGYTCLFELVDEPEGDPQCEDWEHGDRYVNQTCNGGITGDHYEGAVCVPVARGKWFKYRYSI